MKDLSLSSNYKGMIDGAVVECIKYLEVNTNIETFILGLSGGVDSAVTAALARKVCDATPYRKLRLIGYSLPIISNEPEERERAREVGETFCDHFVEVDLTEQCAPLVKAVDNSLYNERWKNTETSLAAKIRIGNIKARMRMIYLYDKAYKYKGLVLSTDNFTEFQLGFWTLHGDVGDFGFIQELWKTEVYGVAELLGEPLRSSVEAKPTDGLGVSYSDISQLLPNWIPNHKQTWRDAYAIIDNILIRYLSSNKTTDPELVGYLLGSGSPDINHPVIKRHKETAFKRENPVNIKRHFLIKD